LGGKHEKGNRKLGTTPCNAIARGKKKPWVGVVGRDKVRRPRRERNQSVKKNNRNQTFHMRATAWNEGANMGALIPKKGILG